MTRFATTGRYGLLLVAILSVLVVAPPLAEAGRGLLVTQALFAFLVLAAALAIGDATRLRRAMVGLAAATIAGDLLLFVLPASGLRLGVRSLGALVLAVVAGAVVARVLRERRVSVDTILGGICGYLLLGFLFHALFTIVELVRPGSFVSGDLAVSELADAEPSGRTAALVYYSFATLTTLGYGDIVARSSLPQMLSVLEALLGQLYLAILVASLVGMRLAARDPAGPTPPR